MPDNECTAVVAALEIGEPTGIGKFAFARQVAWFGNDVVIYPYVVNESGSVI